MARLAPLMTLFSSLLVLFSFVLSRTAVAAPDGYLGYKLDIDNGGDALAVGYETDNTHNNVSVTDPPPDVFLNASVHVGAISVDVQNLAAKVNLDAQVLKLLDFHAGVNLHVDRVTLLIEDVRASVLLEARLLNVVRLINDTLAAIDLNPIIAELGGGLGRIINKTGELITPPNNGIHSFDDESYARLAKRAHGLIQFELEYNILYAVNDYEGNTHTNRILMQNGEIVDQRLNNAGEVMGAVVVGNFQNDMQYTGHFRKVTYHSKPAFELEYLYQPFPGLLAFAGIFVDETGTHVVGTRLRAEAGAGGESVIAEPPLMTPT